MREQRPTDLNGPEAITLPASRRQGPHAILSRDGEPRLGCQFGGKLSFSKPLAAPQADSWQSKVLLINGKQPP